MIINKNMDYSEIKSLLTQNCKESINGFDFAIDPSGSFEWINQKDLNNVIEIYATPNWTENGVLQVEIYHNEDLIKEKEIKFSRLKLMRYKQIVTDESIRYLKKYK